MRFPRSIDRGLIEADLKMKMKMKGLGYFRDQLIAASLKLFRPLAAYIAKRPFPRSIDRGLIEALEARTALRAILPISAIN